MATKMIFVNLPVKNLKKSTDFFTQLDFTFNAQFTDEKAACMVVSNEIYVMLLTEPFFKTFISKEVADANKTAEVIVSFSVDSKQQVDEVITKARNAGATTPRSGQDYGFMYQHGFQDPDGHLWEYFYMDPKAVQG